jgi:hypothetical protein
MMGKRFYESGFWNHILRKQLRKLGLKPRSRVLTRPERFLMSKQRGGQEVGMAATMTLDQLVDRARDHRMTPAERRAQRASLIMGLRGRHSTLTRDKVDELLEEIEGQENSPEG